MKTRLLILQNAWTKGIFAVVIIFRNFPWSFRVNKLPTSTFLPCQVVPLVCGGRLLWRSLGFLTGVVHCLLFNIIFANPIQEIVVTLTSIVGGIRCVIRFFLHKWKINFQIYCNGEQRGHPAGNAQAISGMLLYIYSLTELHFQFNSILIKPNLNSTPFSPWFQLPTSKFQFHSNL